MSDYRPIVDLIRSIYPNQDFVPLHEPRFRETEKKYVIDAIDSTFVSSVGEYVNRFEKDMARYLGADFGVAIVNGTAALHLGLILTGVQRDEEVLTQSLTFVATANAISYIGAKPVFIDVDLDTMGMSPSALEKFLETHADVVAGQTVNKTTGKRIAACVPMHTFGNPCRIDEIVAICRRWNIKVVEDAAESLGSTYKQQMTGTFGDVGCISFNGNKIVTAGGGGVIVTNDEELAVKAKHLSTQAKVPHRWEFNHDFIGYNYRMPNLNAAFICAQLEHLEDFLKNKRQVALRYKDFFADDEAINHIWEIEEAQSNFWLNALVFADEQRKEEFLQFTNDQQVMTRPVWTLMSQLPAYADCQSDELTNSKFLTKRVVNIPSSVTV